MTVSTTTREIHLVRRPVGMPTPADFRIVERSTPVVGPGEILVRNEWLSVDPYMRGRMNAEGTERPAFPLDEAPVGAAVGTVVESGDPMVATGTWVRHMAGWREHSCVPAAEARVIDVEAAAPEAYLGTLGSVGLTAYVGLTVAAPVRPGDVVFVSAAAGAVGIHAARIARHLGASAIIGSAGGDKSALLTSRLGYDVGIDYRAGALSEQLRAAAPQGVDVYFDNVGREHLWAAIDAAAPHARFALCGAISGYNDSSEQRLVPGNLAMATGKRLSLRGFVVSDHLDREREWHRLARGWLREGSFSAATTVYRGLDRMVEAFVGVLAGANVGKTLVRMER